MPCTEHGAEKPDCQAVAHAQLQHTLPGLESRKCDLKCLIRCPALPLTACAAPATRPPVVSREFQSSGLPATLGYGMRAQAALGYPGPSAPAVLEPCEGSVEGGNGRRVRAVASCLARTDWAYFFVGTHCTLQQLRGCLLLGYLRLLASLRRNRQRELTRARQRERQQQEEAVPGQEQRRRSRSRGRNHAISAPWQAEKGAGCWGAPGVPVAQWGSDNCSKSGEAGRCIITGVPGGTPT